MASGSTARRLSQFDSDAIAGVLNFILKESSECGSISGKWGSTYAGDGDIYQIAADIGVPISDQGFLNISAEYGESDATDRSRVIVGQSRGGSFVLYAAYHRPELFDGFIASNPGREWDKTLYGMGMPMPSARTDNQLIVASGSRDRDYLRGTAIEWSNTMPQRTDLPWKATFLDIEGGTHAAILPEVYRRAMLEIFEPEVVD